MSRFMRAMTRPSYEESGSGGEISVEISAEVAAADETATEVAQSVAEIESMAQESDAGAAQAEVVESVADVVAEEGYTRGVSRLVAALGITEIAAYSGVRIAGHESLSSTGRNEVEARKVVMACEGMLGDFGRKIMRFLRSIWDKIKGLFEWVRQKFSNYLKTLEALLKKLRDGTIDPDKAKDKKYKKPKADAGKWKKWESAITKIMTAKLAYKKLPPEIDEKADDDANKSISSYLANLLYGLVGSDTGAGSWSKDKSLSDLFKDFSTDMDTDDEKIADNKETIVTQIVTAISGLRTAETWQKDADMSKIIQAAEIKVKFVDNINDTADKPEDKIEIKKARKELEWYRAIASALSQTVAFGVKLMNKQAQMAISAGNAAVACLK